MTATAERPTTEHSGEEYVARAREVAKIISAEANNIERATTITKTAFEALAEAGLFWILVPKELGGAGLGIVNALEVIEEISRADGSTGWALMANAFSTGIAAGFMNDEGARDMFAGDPKGITAGMILPTGSAVKVQGGYRATGNYQFASGSAHANWIGAGFIVKDENGEPLVGADGQPDCRVAFIPREKIEFRGNWDVMGLVGTGSYDYGVNDVFIPDKYTIETFSTTPVRSEPVYGLGLLGIGVGGHAPVALGIMRHALEEIAAIASVKARPGYPTVVGDSDLFKIEFVKHDALYQAARAYVYKAHADAEATYAAGREISPEQWARLRQVITWTQGVGGQVVGFAHRWGGSQPIRNPSALGRCTRDIAVATQHLLVDQMTLVDAAAPIIASYLQPRD